MKCLITNLNPIESDPDYPQMDVGLVGELKDILLYTYKMEFTGLIRGRYNHAISVFHLETKYYNNEVHLILVGKDLLKLKVGDYLESSG